MNKLINLRDTRRREFKEINEELSEICWSMQGSLAKIILKLLNREKLIRPIWSRWWEWSWAILNSDLRHNLKVLDVGCGGSPLLVYCVRRNIKCFGIDKGTDHMNAGIWDGLKSKLEDICGFRWNWGFYHLGPSITVKKENLAKMSFEDNFFDRVFCISVIEHLSCEERSKGLPEIVRVLKPGGKIIITMDLKTSEYEYKEIIQLTGLKLHQPVDHSNPREKRHSHPYDVVGFTLEK